VYLYYLHLLSVISLFCFCHLNGVHIQVAEISIAGITANVETL